MGASGDLAPLSHLAAGKHARDDVTVDFDGGNVYALGLMGIGRMWSRKTGWGNAMEVLQQNGLEPIEYKPKEVRRMASRVGDSHGLE